MTIETTVRTAGPFSGNDSVSAFPFAFKVFSSGDVAVYRTDSSDPPVTTTLVLDTDYTVSLNADQSTDPGGTVTLTDPLAVGYTLLISSDIPILQPVDLTNLGGFYPSIINAALDRLTIIDQQLQAQLSGAVPVGVESVGLQVAQTIAALRGLSINSGYPVAITLGSTAAGDGQARLWWWDPSYSGADDGALTILPNGWTTDGRWRWVPNLGLVAATQAEMVTGTETALRALSPLRVAQGAGAVASAAITAATPATATQAEMVTGTESAVRSLSPLRVAEGAAAVVDARPRCVAWVTFNASGTPAILASSGVSGLTDNGVGDFTINFSPALADSNYCAVASANFSSTTAWVACPKTGTTPTTTALRILVIDDANAADLTRISVAIFR